MSEDQDEQLHSKARDERFVYVNITAILLQQADDPASPRSSIAFVTPINTPSGDGALGLIKVHHTNDYHVILPCLLAGDRSDRTRIETKSETKN